MYFFPISLLLLSISTPTLSQPQPPADRLIPLSQIEDIASNILPLYLAMIFSDEDVKSTMREIDSCFEENSELFFGDDELWKDLYELLDYCDDPVTKLVKAGTEFLDIVLSAVQKCPSVEVFMAKGMRGFYQRIEQGKIVINESSQNDFMINPTLQKFDGTVPPNNIPSAEKIAQEALTFYATTVQLSVNEDLKAYNIYKSLSSDQNSKTFKLFSKNLPNTLTSTVAVLSQATPIVKNLLEEESGLLEERLLGETPDVESIRKAAELGVETLRKLLESAAWAFKEPIENICARFKVVVSMVEESMKVYDGMFKGVVGIAA